MDDSSGVILRQKEQLEPGILLVNPPDSELLAQIPAGYFMSLHHGQWIALSQQAGWVGQFGLDDHLAVKCAHAIVWMPKARRELDLLVAWTQAQLLPGARLWLVGAKRAGVESSGKALKKSLGCGTKLDSARHCQLWDYRLDNPQVHFEPAEWISEHTMAVPLGNGNEDAALQVADMPGVFSEGRLDEGTRLLLKALPALTKSPVLDFACGAGVIAAAILRQMPKLKLTLLDVQWQALVSARRTLAANGMSGDVIAGDGLGEIKERFATIVTNPPFHSGLKTDLNIVRQFIVQARSRLLPGGTLWLVANAFLPYRELLEEQFSTVTTEGENNRFRVYRAQAR